MIDFSSTPQIITSTVKILVSIIMLLHIFGVFVLNRQVKLASENVKTDNRKKILLLSYWHVILLTSLLVVIIVLPV